MPTKNKKAPQPQKEIRTLQKGTRVELRNADEGMPTLIGYAAVFGMATDLGWYREEIAPGAFARSLTDNDDVRALYNHDSSQVIGRRSASTLRLSEDATGLRVEIDLPDTTAARDLVANIEAGNIDGMSFGFRAREQQWDIYGEGEDEVDLRRLIDVELIEVSPVTFPAYPDTTIAQRSLEAVRHEKNSQAGPDSEEPAEVRVSDEVLRLRAARHRR